MSTLSQFMGGGIKSVQRGVFAGSSNLEQTINISPVNPAKAFVNVTSAYSPHDRSYTSRLRLSSSTTLAAISSINLEVGHPLYWEVIEFY